MSSLPVYEFNSGRVMRDLLDSLNAEMQRAAEPMLQQALRDMEKAMRAKIAERCIALLEQNLRMTMRGSELTIVVNQAARRE